MAPKQFPLKIIYFCGAFPSDITLERYCVRKCSLGLRYEAYAHLNFDNTKLLSGEGNGTPLKYSCLENPMDGGAW